VLLLTVVKKIGSSDTNMLEAAEPVQLQQELMEALALNIRQMLFGIWIDYNIPFLYLAFFYVGIIS